MRDQIEVLRADAPAKIAELQTDLDDANVALQDLKDRLNGTNTNNTGFLAQLDGLDAASAHSSTLRMWKWLIFLAFVLLDVLPVVSKLGWLFSREGRDYHDAVVMQDQSGLTARRAELLAEEKVRQAYIDKDTQMRMGLDAWAIQEAEATLKAKLQQEMDAWKVSVQNGTGPSTGISGLSNGQGRQP